MKWKETHRDEERGANNREKGNEHWNIRGLGNGRVSCSLCSQSG